MRPTRFDGLQRRVVLVLVLFAPLGLIALRVLVLLLDEPAVGVGLGGRMLAFLVGPAGGEERPR
jgi:hypothetical protein